MEQITIEVKNQAIFTKDGKQPKSRLEWSNGQLEIYLKGDMKAGMYYAACRIVCDICEARHIPQISMRRQRGKK